MASGTPAVIRGPRIGPDPSAEGPTTVTRWRTIVEPSPLSRRPCPKRIVIPGTLVSSTNMLPGSSATIQIHASYVGTQSMLVKLPECLSRFVDLGRPTKD